MPVAWVDGVTPVNAANLEQLDTDIAAVKVTADAAAPALAAHVAAADPHTGYQKETEKAAANGYASLDGTGVVPDAQIPAAIARDAEVTAAVAAHAAAADPHTGYQKETERAAANGYAPLDGAALVPLVHLPPVSGVDYIGNWGAGTAYKQGDVVRYNGVDYLAVNPSTGQTPPAATPMVGGIGTSLPASPIDGQAFTLVDSLTAPTYAWQCRYVASITDAYKWLVIGGDAKRARLETDYPANAALSMTVPNAGYYNIGNGGTYYDANVDTIIACYLTVAGAGTHAYWSYRCVGSMAGYMGSGYGETPNVLCGAGAAIAQLLNVTASTRIERRWVSAMPVRLA